jgi:hypothetical protein
LLVVEVAAVQALQEFGGHKVAVAEPWLVIQVLQLHQGSQYR